MESRDIKQIVKEKYGQAATRVKSGKTSCCSATGEFCGADAITQNLQPANEMAILPEQAVLGRKAAAADNLATNKRLFQIYDPAMCCSTGVCGPVVDPKLPRFAADLQWLADEGIVVERFNLAQQPEAFAANGQVKQALESLGTDCLPLILVNGAIVSKGAYPERTKLAQWAGLESSIKESIYTESVAELVAIGAAIASNCEPCFKYHYDRARKLGVSKEDMMMAVEMAQAVKDSPARSVLALANRYLGKTGQADNSRIAMKDNGGSKSSCCS